MQILVQFEYTMHAYKLKTPGRIKESQTKIVYIYIYIYIYMCVCVFSRTFHILRNGAWRFQG
jgi:hypothetical protein